MKYSTLTVLLIFIFGCSVGNNPRVAYDDSSKTEESSESDDDKETKKFADIPIRLDSTNYLLHPIGEFKIKDRSGKWIYSSTQSNSGYSVSYFGGQNLTGNLSNITFQHKDSSQLRSLTSKKLKIQSVYFLELGLDSSSESILKKYVLVYQVRDDDTNKDGKIDSDDIASLYLSDDRGLNFTKLNSPGNHVVNWQVVESMNRLYFRSLQDTNKDGEFDSKDTMHYGYVNFNESFEVEHYFPIG